MTRTFATKRNGLTDSRAYAHLGGSDGSHPTRQSMSTSPYPTRALLDSGALVVERDADLAELAEREPQLWRCKKERSGPQDLEPCPECGSMPGVVQIIHTDEAAIL